MFGIKTRKLEKEVEAMWLSFSRHTKLIDALESRIRALEEATKPKSGRMKK